MKCPLCLSNDERFTVIPVISREPHGEVFKEDVIECQSCGGRFSQDDLVQEPEELRSHEV